ncbi:hypothetical protein FA13DRAFT_1473818 [Coprinellus micaceus]|uniref:Uncharacterized protein n=1 Tax=Coprinellus micaceus TaxID=71717 RepID=A0A4Y7SLL9_COPMI|nr:hypothetical protein FA13DRAFT_1473818 [Coprinellus micaceus]
MPYPNIDSTRLDISPIGYVPRSVQSPRNLSSRPNHQRSVNPSATRRRMPFVFELGVKIKFSAWPERGTDYDQMVITFPPRPHSISQSSTFESHHSLVPTAITPKSLYSSHATNLPNVYLGHRRSSHSPCALTIPCRPSCVIRRSIVGLIPRPLNTRPSCERTPGKHPLAN